MHKFAVGQIVHFSPDADERRVAMAGPCAVTKQLPEIEDEPAYRIQVQREGYERVAREKQLRLL